MSCCAGKPTGSEEEVEAAVKELQGKGVKQVLVKLGKDGCILYGASDQPIKQGIFPVEKVGSHLTLHVLVFVGFSRQCSKAGSIGICWYQRILTLASN